MGSRSNKRRMRFLFEMDRHDYGDCTHTAVRDSARSLIIRDGKVAMIYSRKHDYYKFPGGGIEKGETPVDAMIRETREEAGLIVIPESIREFGYVHRIQKSSDDPTLCFIQDNYYYLCDAREEVVPQQLENDELAESFVLEFVDPRVAIRKNRELAQKPNSQARYERAARILEILIDEEYLR